MRKIDFRSFGQDGKDGDDANFDKRWWACPKEDRHRNVIKVVQAIADQDSRRQTQYQISTRLYGNIHLMGLNGLSLSKSPTNQTALKDRISYNVIQAGVDTLTAKMVKNKPKPLFLTEGGSWKLQRKAKKLDKFVEGIFYENETYKLGGLSFRDSAIVGDGLVHVFNHHSRVKHERALASELYVDPIEAFYGYPRQLHRVKNIDRQVLIDLFPEHKERLLAANAAKADFVGTAQNVSDQITVVESWYLPSGPKAKDGIHTINIEEGNLLDEAWTKDYFPFAKLPYAPRMYGYWAAGMAERGQNTQLEINKLLWVIQRSMHLAGTFKVWLKTGGKIVKEHVNNDIGLIIESEEAPQYLSPPIVQPEIYQHLQTLKNQFFEQEGVSQLSATSQKPAGLNSGKALREYNDIETDRFQTIGQAYERFYLDIARMSIDCAKDIYEKEKKYEVKLPGRKFIETIDWKDVNLDDDSFLMKVYPVSSLPNDPAGRLQTVQEYMQAGMIDQQTGKRLLDFPDLERINSLQGAMEDWITEVLEDIVETGKASPVEPEMDLQLAKKLVLQYIADGHVNGLEKEKMAKLRQFNDGITAMIQKAQPPGPPAGAPGQPLAQPMAPPQSDLIPNVPQPVGAA
jgi:hypothetical protein